MVRSVASVHRHLGWRPSLSDVVSAVPSFISPALARPGELPADGCALEIKWDGMRGQVRWDGQRLAVRSRPGRECGDAFSELVAGLGVALAGRPPMLLDGEIVCFDDEGYPDFAALRRRIIGRPGRRATFMAFDLLHLDQESLLATPYRDRRALLEASVAETTDLRVPRPLDATPAEVIAVVAEHHLEGVIAKRWDGVYASGQRRWVKHKVRRSEAVVIRGWRLSAERGVELLVGRPDHDGGLVPAGAIGIVAPSLRDELRQTLEAAPLPRDEVLGGSISRCPRSPTATGDRDARCATRFSES